MTSSSPISLVSLVKEHYHGEWGFTGTRAGMHPYQTGMIRRLLMHGQPLVFRHGCAFGADAEAHALWREICPGAVANVWPADVKRALLFRGQANVKVEPVMAPLDRNVEIAKRSAFMLATPHTEYEVQRSGTWATIRAALKADKPVLIIWPESRRMTLCRDRVLYRVVMDIL